MQKFLFLIFSFSLLLSSCTGGFEEPETPIEAGREFINAIYNGNFKKANKLIKQDKENKALLKSIFEKNFRARGGFEKEALSKASIQIRDIITEDSTHTLIRFDNAYFSCQSDLMVEKKEAIWRINLTKSDIKTTP
jgi:hypothetical protein